MSLDNILNNWSDYRKAAEDGGFYDPEGNRSEEHTSELQSH